MLGDSDVHPTDDLHVAFSGVTFALWIAVPLVAARRAHGASPVARRLSRALGLSTLAALVVGVGWRNGRRRRTAGPPSE